MKDFITIDERRIGKSYPPFIIAEMSANHNGDICRAFKIMEEAKKAGASAIKLQSYTHDTITIDCDKDEFQVKGGLWGGQTLYDLYKGAHMPWDWHEPLFEKAKSLGITIFSSPFDFSAVDLLESLNAPAYKVASFEVIDLPLIKRIAQTGKPLIISTGMASKHEIGAAIKTATENGCEDLVILHCVSEYPADASGYNLRTIPDMSKEFGVLVGLSDHTIDNATALASIALGACVIEKHVTLDRKGGGVDDTFSLEPAELKQLCTDAKTAWQSLGRVSYERSKAEQANSQFRRSLYVVKDIVKGEELTEENIKSIRPGYGLHPQYYYEVMGKIACQDIQRGTALQFALIR